MGKRNDIGGARRLVVASDEPAPTVMAGGIGSVNTSQYSLQHLTGGGANLNKPPYAVPSMAEIAAMEWNGFNIVSTFSGCGGSCLGYRMAGFRVLWANEFIPEAQKTYKANHPDSILDTRDIRTVQPGDILKSIGLQEGELDLFDGSPPCASFSTAGKREAGWGKIKKYSDSQQRTDDLFFEYARILKGLQPKVFIAENVSGLVKGTAKGYFKEILAALRACGYVVEAQLLDAQWLGVPQMRQRIIFQGVRTDLGLRPVFPKPLPYRYSVKDALPWIAAASNDSKGLEGVHVDNVNSEPLPTIRAGGGGHQTGWRVEVESANGLGSIGQSRGHIWTDVTSAPMPTVQASRPVNIRIEPETDISQYAIGKEWDKLKPGEQSEKYFQLVKPGLSEPCPTITQRGGDNTVASVVHPTEKRKFTIAELRRICGFPDDFILTGSYAQQWERCGRAVPPVMMMHIAAAVRDGVLCKLK